ncbi:capsule polysaccharide transporter [Sulfitobacter sp. EE-36]|jgi:capsular polysaccharide transport system permease protein|uniref:capsule polysaccharide transporter n=1 Tax=Sulfitobacter TaxID=60136 RepID=UPI000066905F|nr:capsule polysaccharide transporter [Sulfitobacter sp. EE-36]EAP84936.1 capsular polysaccharide export inner-membrane protein,BexC/CtrB/KpsE family protein [Sulfitobacter sp. EE-36]
MTTKPKARKFRIKRATPAAAPKGTDAVERDAPAAAPPKPQAPDAPRAAAASRGEAPRAAAPSHAAAASAARPTPPSDARSGEVSSATEVSGEQDIDAIRREGLTGRQLRMARRVAQKHGLAPTSDFDAVRLLRAEGIDPFQRSNMLELVVPQDKQSTGTALQKGRIQLPQTVPAGGRNLPSTDVNPMERRMREISDIQRDITKRRRRKMGLLMVRLAFFVGLPTIMGGYYFYNIATPMYATDSQFLIIQNEGTGGLGPLGGLLPTQFANSADSIATQSYLQSKDAMLRLDRDVGFMKHFSDPAIDPIQRMNPDASNEEAYKHYKDNVKIGYDPTEGMIRMEVIAADPEVAKDFSEHLLEYAEERVNALSQQKREDGMRDAREAYEQTVAKRREAQEALIKLQVDNGVDPQAVIASIRGQITNYETLLLEKELELAALLDNPRPNRAKVDGAQGDVRRLSAQLDKLNERMNSATEGTNSLAQQAVSLQLAQADLAAADAALQASQTQMEQARTEASRQVRYLTVAVRPVASQSASYPRKFENTILTFLIFAGIYLMLSLTSSILKEQVTK